MTILEHTALQLRLSAWISVVAMGPGNCENMGLSRDSQGYEDFLVIYISILFSFFQVRYILLIIWNAYNKKVKRSNDRVSE